MKFQIKANNPLTVVESFSCYYGRRRRCLNTVISKEQVIKEVARREGIALTEMQSLYSTLENYIFETLSSATSVEDIELKLFNGISIDCKYKVEKKMIHPENGELFETNAKIWAKPRITRYYNRKLNGYFEN